MDTARWELVVIVTRSPRCACRVVFLSDAVPIIVERLLVEQSVCRPPEQRRLSTKFPKSHREGSDTDECHADLTGIGAYF